MSKAAKECASTPEETVIVSIGRYNINKGNLPYQCCKNMVTGEIYYIANKYVPFTLGEKIYSFDELIEQFIVWFVVKSVQYDEEDKSIVVVNDDDDLLFNIDDISGVSSKNMLQENTIMVGRIVMNGKVRVFVPEIELEFNSNPANPTWYYYAVDNKGRLSDIPSFMKHQIPTVTFGGECMSNLLDFANKNYYAGKHNSGL